MINECIRVSNLCKDYGSFQLKNVSFNLPQGCIMGLIGENGAGKSTTLKLLLNLLKKDGGEIALFGLDPAKQEHKIKEQIGVVFDENFFTMCCVQRISPRLCVRFMPIGMIGSMIRSARDFSCLLKNGSRNIPAA